MTSYAQTAPTSTEPWTWSLADLRARLAHEDPDVRSWALRRLALFSPAEGGAAAVRLLTDRETSVQGEAIRVLEDAPPGGLPDDTAKALQAYLDSRPSLPGLRASAEELIASIRKGDAPAAIEAPTAWEGLSCAEVLRRVGEKSSDDDVDSAISLLAARPDELRSITPACFGDKQFEVKLVVFDALERQPYRWASDLILCSLDLLLTGDGDSVALETLEEMADPASLPALLAEWRPGEPSYARVIRFIARVAGTDGNLPPALLAEAEERSRMEVAFLRSMAASIGTEEDIPLPMIDSPRLELRCNRCRRLYTYDVGMVWISPPKKKWFGEDWEGITPARIVTCKKCGAVDDYQVGGRTHAVLIAAMMKAAASKKAEDLPPWMQVAIMTLWDGTEVRRVSEGLMRLRTQAAAHPERVECWRRIGNFCGKIGLPEESEAAFRQALKVQAEDVESVYGLGQTLAQQARWKEVAPLLARVIQLLPESEADRDLRFDLAVDTLALIKGIMERTGERLTLQAVWKGGEGPRGAVANVSGLDLHRLRDWDALAEFLVDEQTFGATLSHEPVGAPPTMLESLLRERQCARARSTPRDATASRNAPCPCGSGKKYKRCCGRS